jgi:glycogen debranching enzyme
MTLTIPAEDTFYIVATDSAIDEVSRVLKDGETFAVFDRHGDIQAVGQGQEGLYHEGTRFLSRLVLKLGNGRPFLLNSTVKEDNLLFIVNLTNPDIYQSGQVILPRGTLHITRTKWLHTATCYETLRIINYGLAGVDVHFAIELGADFADIFEVRGMTRQRRGHSREPQLQPEQILFAYEGLDHRVRRMRVLCSPYPTRVNSTGAVFHHHLGPKQEQEFSLSYSCEIDGSASSAASDGGARAEAERELSRFETEECHVYTSNQQFNDWLTRSSADIHMMFTRTPFGLYPYAGVPWFSTPFGRDGIITALEYLWINPEIAKGVLGYLASTQARQLDPARDAQPGKILHETRKGEMAALGEIPFDLYYGSVDATPLFIILAAAYLDRTNDVPFIRGLWPQIELALHWMEEYGDKDRDGFIEYARYSSHGLIQQGWKDSWDSVFHADGALAAPPIALCEVQGYAHAAKGAGAAIASALGDAARANALLAEGTALKRRFQREFWCEEIGSYAMALDGQKNQCRVRASNAGHCLYTGIADADQAARIAVTLMDDHSFSGWGVRTIAATEARYNPMSYHNGSIWPHDNALIAAGLARYGFKEYAVRILSGLFEASLFVEYRLPELFCGFSRREGEGPVPYPVACSPQAWSAASVFLLLQAIFGMKIEAAISRVSFVRPLLPQFLDAVWVKNLKLNGASVDLVIQRRGRYATIEIERREGHMEVFTEALI